MTVANLVAYPPYAWGHVKPLLAFFARLAERRPASALVFTLLTCKPLLPKIWREIELMPGDLSERLIVVDVGSPASLMQTGDHSDFTSAFESLWEAKAVECQLTHKAITAPRPTALVIDPFSAWALPIIKKASGGLCPIVVWMAIPMSTLLNIISPEEWGGAGDVQAKLEAAARETGKTIEEVGDSVLARPDGSIFRMPGLPEIYEYENSPQDLASPVPIALLVKGSYQFISAADGVINVASSAFERECIEWGRKCLADMGTELWIVGPLEEAPPGTTAAIPGAEIPEHAAEDQSIFHFLDDMKSKYGLHSVLYVAFGTMYWPKKADKLQAFIETLIETNTPFLWSHASPLAHVAQELDDKISASGIGYHASWVPQRAVLADEAIGWFVTHGGWNSIQEALSLRVPMVMWPFATDQPRNAAITTRTHEAAFEIMSVREGNAARQPRALEGEPPVDFSVEGVRNETRELLMKIRGPEGERIRTNATVLGEALDKSWKPGGEAITEVERFLHKFVDGL